MSYTLKSLRKEIVRFHNADTNETDYKLYLLCREAAANAFVCGSNSPILKEAINDYLEHGDFCFEPSSKIWFNKPGNSIWILCDNKALHTDVSGGFTTQYNLLDTLPPKIAIDLKNGVIPEGYILIYES